jgi:hypothetical protein
MINGCLFREILRGRLCCQILSAAWAPRVAFVNYPLGHQAGKPFQPEDQLRLVTAALGSLEAHTAPGQVNVLECEWGTAVDSCAEVGSSRNAKPQKRDETVRYQRQADLDAAVATLGEEVAGGIVSEEAVRQHGIFAEK